MDKVKQQLLKMLNNLWDFNLLML